MTAAGPPPRPPRWRPSGVGVAVGGLAGLLARDLDLATLVSYWGDRAPLVVGAAVLGALAWPTRLRRLVAAATVLLALTWIAVAFTPVSRWLSDGLVRRDPLRAADAVFVLASRLQSDGDPTTVEHSRLLHGLELLAQGHAPRLIVSELPSGPARARLARARLAGLGLDREVLEVGPVRTTREEAVAVGRLVRRRGFGRVLVVTSPTHSLRACLALEREGVEVVSSPAPETRFDLETLDRPSERLEAFGSLAHERLGLVVYARRGWLGPPPPDRGPGAGGDADVTSP